MNLQFPWMWGISWLAEWYAETYELAFQRLLGWHSCDCAVHYAMSIRGNTVLPSVGGLRELSHWNLKFLLEQNHGIGTAFTGNPSCPATLCDFSSVMCVSSPARTLSFCPSFVLRACDRLCYWSTGPAAVWLRDC